jgi:HlyD family secretion protein
VTRGRLIAAALVLLAVAGGAFYCFVVREDEAPTAFQGYMEGNLVYMAPEEGGRIERLAVEVGDAVAEGQFLFGLESSVQIAQRNEAEARLRQAEAQLANLKSAMQRPEQVAVLQAQEARARAQLQLSRNEYERQQTLFQKGITAKAQLDQARSAFDRDTAALEETQRQIQAAQLTSRSGEIDAAEAMVRAGEAMLRQAETRVEKRRVAAPASARVQDIFFRAGEVVNAGQPVLALLPPANLRVRFYVPEPMLSTLSLGQAVTIACDNCGAGYGAKVSFISREAEYTPPVIFSEQERAKLVFRLEARPVQELTLPVGLPVTVRPLEAAPAASRSP